MRCTVVDAGGTHVRFAIADFIRGQRPNIGRSRRYRTRDFPDLLGAWRNFAEDAAEPLPDSASIGVAAPVGGKLLRFVNNDWTIDLRTLRQDLAVNQLTVLNDFGAMAHAVSVLDPDELIAIQGQSDPLPTEGVTTVIGPGTGLGVAMLVRREDRTMVLETDGSHIGFSPGDAEEIAIVDSLRNRYGRVSVERIVSGPGLVDLARALSQRSDGQAAPLDSSKLWAEALGGRDPLAIEAMDRLTMAFGSAAGDLALAHGANAVVIVGSLANRMIERLRTPAFLDRFRDKGRYRDRMESLPVKLATHPEPGLLGAAVAFAREHELHDHIQS